jgi:plasmid segregation protein ParM
MFIPVAALDLGFGHTKMAKRFSYNPHLTDFSSFPSLAPRSIKSDAKIHDDLIEQIYTVHVNGVDFSVGPHVKLVAGGAAGAGRALNEDYPTTVNYKALFLGALAHLEATQIEVLVMGLPVNTMKKHKNFVLNEFRGEFDLCGKKVIVNNVFVIPQPIGAILHYGESINTQISADDTYLVNDFGYGTSDWVTAKGSKTIESRSDGETIGVSTILKSVASLISRDIGRKFSEIERIDDAIIEKKHLQVFGNVFTPENLLAYVKSSQYIADECANKIYESVGNGNDLKTIINVGGGATYFTESVKAVYPGVNVEILEKPRYSVVSGLLEYGETQFRKLVAA